jgi:hypothetical protein
MDPFAIAGVLYGAGVLLVALFLDEPFPARLGYALGWPIAPAAFAVTIALLLLALPLARPVAGTILLALVAGLVWTGFAWLT